MRLPSLKSIEAFDAAAKHLNFTRAGNELSISSAAVSQRVATLEGLLGFELFERHGPKLTMTDAGRACRPVLSRALSQMRDAVGSLQEVTRNPVLTIKASPSFAQKWLVPRLPRFYSHHPEIDLRVWSTTNTVKLEEGDPSLAIYYGIELSEGLPETLVVDFLFQERVFPVASPAYADKHRLRDLADLRNATLLHDDTTRRMGLFPNWRRWCDAFDIRDVNTRRGPRYVVSSIAQEAAVDGQGVGLGRGALVRDDLAAGRLIRPFPECYPLSFQYLFVYPMHFPQRRSFRLFREWLLREAGSHNDGRNA